jgi:hypothetical protein
MNETDELKIEQWMIDAAKEQVASVYAWIGLSPEFLNGQIDKSAAIIARHAPQADADAPTLRSRPHHKRYSLRAENANPPLDTAR